MDDIEKTMFVTILAVILAPYLLISVWAIVTVKPTKPRYVPLPLRDQSNA
jgi:hypothetical protein